MTYIKTAALYLMIVLAALTASPATALAVGVLFGLVRGLAVLLGRGITSPAALAAFHRRFTDAGPVVLAVVVAGELLVAVAFAAVLSPWLAPGARSARGCAGGRGGPAGPPAGAGGAGPDVRLAAHVHGVDVDGDDPDDDAAVSGRRARAGRRCTWRRPLGEGAVVVGLTTACPGSPGSGRVLQVEEEAVQAGSVSRFFTFCRRVFSDMAT